MTRALAKTLAKTLTKALVPTLISALALTACTSAAVAPLPKPPAVKTPPTSTSVPDYSNSTIALASVHGNTTTTAVSLSPGKASLQGHAYAPSGPAAGARIHIERLVGEQSAAMDVYAAADGTWSAANLIGGRYRIRAYRPPDATMTQAQVLFLGGAENRTLDLNLSAFSGGTSVQSAIAPNPPILGQNANVAVSVTSRAVDSSGVARAIPTPGLSLVLTSVGGLAIASVNPQITDGNGRAQWTIQCTSVDNQGLSVLLPDGTSSILNMPACQLPPTTTTTTTIPTTTLAPTTLPPTTVATVAPKKH